MRSYNIQTANTPLWYTEWGFTVNYLSKWISHPKVKVMAKETSLGKNFYSIKSPLSRKKVWMAELVNFFFQVSFIRDGYSCLKQVEYEYEYFFKIKKRLRIRIRILRQTFERIRIYIRILFEYIRYSIYVFVFVSIFLFD